MKRCEDCHFYQNGKCEDVDGLYFLLKVRKEDSCPEFLLRREEGYNLTEILNHLDEEI